jgi:hypothetical protein
MHEECPLDWYACVGAGIATGYVLDGRGSSRGRDKRYSTACRPTQPPVLEVLGALSLGQSKRGMKPTITSV